MDIQLILSTHSPILLSDIPQQSVIYLKSNKEKSDRKVEIDNKHIPTFGQNIHLLFRDSFFLENGIMGEFAKKKIQECFDEIQKIEKEIKEMSTGKEVTEERYKEYNTCLAKQKNIATLVAEPIIKKKLLLEIQRVQNELPRYFAVNKEDAYDFIKRTYRSEWAIIIHESITVRDSFELYLDEEKCILEHVPGMWESDNKEETDIWIYRNNYITSYTANGIRRARYEDAENQEYKMVLPYKEEEIVEIAKEVSSYIQVISQNWLIKEGVNFHFVKDDDGRVFFLNHRKISRIQDWELRYENLTAIETVEDL